MSKKGFIKATVAKADREKVPIDDKIKIDSACEVVDFF